MVYALLIKESDLGGWLDVLKGVVIMIKSNLGLRIMFILKDNLRVLSSRSRKEVVPRMVNQPVPNVA